MVNPESSVCMLRPAASTCTKAAAGPGSLPKVMISGPRKELCLPEHLISSVRGLFIKAPALLPQVSLTTIVSQAHPEIREVSLPWLVRLTDLETTPSGGLWRHAGWTPVETEVGRKQLRL